MRYVLLVLALLAFLVPVTAQDPNACTPAEAQEVIEFYDDNALNDEYDDIGKSISAIVDSGDYDEVIDLLYDKVWFYIAVRRSASRLPECTQARNLMNAYSLAYTDRIMSVSILAAAVDDAANLDRWSDLLPDLDAQFTDNILNVQVHYAVLSLAADE